MKQESTPNRRTRMTATLATILLFSLITCILLVALAIKSSNIHKMSIEERGRLAVFTFDIKVEGVAKPISIRAVVSQETKFRVSYSIARDFKNIDEAQLERKNILWTQEFEPNSKEYLPDSWAGLFLAFDGDFGYIQSRLHSHRIYRKHLDKFEIDYVFSSDSVPRNELDSVIRQIDAEVLNVLKKNGAFTK